jgi:3-hydroxyacyl-CoA dehydrogenase
MTRPRDPAADPDAFAAQKTAIRKKARGQLSPLAAIDAVERSLTLRRRRFRRRTRGLHRAPGQRAIRSPRHIFFAERAVSRIPETRGVAPRPLSQIGVLGGGTMGAGIACACLLSGLHVTIVERDDQRAGIARGRVLGILDDSAKRGLLTPRRAPMPNRADRRHQFRPPCPCRPHHRGRVRGHGRQEGRLRRA